MRLLHRSFIDELEGVEPDRGARDVAGEPLEPDSRIEELAEKSTEGDLLEEERAEYEGYVRANMFIAILQRQARRVVAAEP